MDDVSNEGEHSNSSVLNLGMTQETNSFLVCASPEASFCQVQRVVEAKNWVEVFGESLQVGLGFLDSDRSA